MGLERVDAARVVGGGDPQQDADHEGQGEDHKRHAHCSKALVRRHVWVLPDRKLGTSPAVGQVGWFNGGALRRSDMRRVVHVLSSVRGWC